MVAAMRNVVLIADPDPFRLEVLLDGFEAMGFQCLTATTGSDALATAGSYVPQLAILHAELPEVEGTDVCLRLKQEPRTQKIAVLLIGKDAHEERFVGSEVGADAYLPEPYTEEDLFVRVRQMFDELRLNDR